MANDSICRIASDDSWCTVTHFFYEHLPTYSARILDDPDASIAQTRDALFHAICNSDFKKTNAALLWMVAAYKWVKTPLPKKGESALDYAERVKKRAQMAHDLGPIKPIGQVIRCEQRLSDRIFLEFENSRTLEMRVKVKDRRFSLQKDLLVANLS